MHTTTFFYDICYPPDIMGQIPNALVVKASSGMVLGEGGRGGLEANKTDTEDF